MASRWCRRCSWKTARVDAAARRRVKTSPRYDTGLSNPQRQEAPNMSWFALATYRTGSAEAPAVVVDNKLYDARQALPKGVAGAIADWTKAQAAVRELGEQARAGNLSALGEGLKALTAPIRPVRIFCAASNYIEHAREMRSVLDVVRCRAENAHRAD